MATQEAKTAGAMDLRPAIRRILVAPAFLPLCSSERAIDQTQQHFESNVDKGQRYLSSTELSRWPNRYRALCSVPPVQYPQSVLPSMVPWLGLGLRKGPRWLLHGCKTRVGRYHSNVQPRSTNVPFSYGNPFPAPECFWGTNYLDLECSTGNFLRIS